MWQLPPWISAYSTQGWHKHQSAATHYFAFTSLFSLLLIYCTLLKLCFEDSTVSFLLDFSCHKCLLLKLYKSLQLLINFQNTFSNFVWWYFSYVTDRDLRHKSKLFTIFLILIIFSLFIFSSGKLISIAR